MCSTSSHSPRPCVTKWMAPPSPSITKSSAESGRYLPEAVRRRYYLSRQQPVYRSRKRSVYLSRQQPVYLGREQPVYLGRQQPVYRSRKRPVYLSRQQPVYLSREQLTASMPVPGIG